MDGNTAVEIIKQKFQNEDYRSKIPLQRDGFFTAKVVNRGVEVDDLGSKPFLPWEVFIETINLLVRNGGRAERGDAINSKLGDVGLSLESIEGHIARVVYGKRTGDGVFQRISPIVAILVWADLCDSAPRQLILR